MVKTYSLNKNNTYYYDLDNKCIARFPSKSNLLPNGSDNSLYFGNKNNECVQSIFCSLFEVDSIDKINGKHYKMKCIDEKVDLETNINADGQVQLKIMKNGTMFRLANNYSLIEMKKWDFTKMLLVVDFANNEIRFKNPKELYL